MKGWHSAASHFFLKSFLKELLKPPFSCFRLLSLRGVWLHSSAPPLHFVSSPHDWNPVSWKHQTSIIHSGDISATVVVTSGFADFREISILKMLKLLFGSKLKYFKWGTDLKYPHYAKKMSQVSSELCRDEKIPLHTTVVAPFCRKNAQTALCDVTKSTNTASSPRLMIGRSCQVF